MATLSDSIPSPGAGPAAGSAAGPGQRIMQLLHDDHRHVERLLDMMDAELDKLHSGGVPDFALVVDVMDYMTHFPDFVHHPREDLIYRQLQEADPGSRRSVAAALAEHEEISDHGARFLKALRRSLADIVLRRELLETEGRVYIDQQRRHMELEESVLFPRIMETLNEDDWLAVEEALKSREDPVFGTFVLRIYRSLYERMTD